MFPDLSHITWILWLVIVIACVVLELITLDLHFGMIAAGCLLGGLGSWLLGWPWFIQVGLAAVISGLLVFIIRPLLWRLLVKGRPAQLTNVAALIGMEAKATVAFTDGSGLARLANGETWTARLIDANASAPIAPGTRLTVTAIEGATAVVSPADLTS